MDVVIPDYGCGNLASVRRMVEKAGGSALVSREPVAEANRIILAGVGAFDHGMQCLQRSGWQDALNEHVLTRKRPLLGICLGMQLLCESSEEGSCPGLGWIAGKVLRFDPNWEPNLKIPHMGWNTVDVKRQNPLIPSEEGEQRFYFVHSYFAECSDARDILATAHHGKSFAAAIGRGHIYGVQFHPEKSHRFGMALLKRFVELAC